MMGSKTIGSLIVDAGPLITGDSGSLRAKAEVLYTTPRVISEIKDERAREALKTWEGLMEKRVPSADSLSFGRCCVQ